MTLILNEFEKTTMAYIISSIVRSATLGATLDDQKQFYLEFCEGVSDIELDALISIKTKLQKGE